MGRIRFALLGCLCASAAAFGGRPASASPAAGKPVAYVLVGEDGRAVARIVTSEAACPPLIADGRRRTMIERAGPAVLPQRPTQSTPENSRPSAFPVRICEATLPHGVRAASIFGRPLPVPRARIDRIVVIGDTGCRLKASDHAWQACDDPAAWPFARVAARAAAWRPDLVVHVGDYLYRENPCPAGQPGCAGSPWGYGWDAWQADFFAPAGPLLRAAPWVVTRGNHESCTRAGQGWWRLLDPRPLVPARDCNDPRADTNGNYSPPYAVGLGGGARIVVMDLSAAGNHPIAPDDPRSAQFAEAYRALARLAAPPGFTFAVDHYPILGLSARTREGHDVVRPANHAIRSVFARQGPLLPAGVDILLAGHVHLWEQLSFAAPYPSQFIAGFSGTQEDVVPLPETLPAGVTPVPGVRVTGYSAWTRGFGFMTMTRLGARRWRVEIRDVDGAIVRRCRIEGRASRCR